MDRIRIRGGRELSGTIEISGAKNSALKLMAASLLTDEPLVLSRMPRLADTRFLGQLLAHLGAQVEEQPGARLSIHAGAIAHPFAPYDLVRKMRASFNVLGPLLAREGRAKVSLPGGCAIGARPVNLHLEALEALGAQIELAEGYVIATAPTGGLTGGRVTFPMVSVGATEHAMLTAALAKGETVLENCAQEPEIADLAGCLNAMGANVQGAGEAVIRIQGVDRLSGADWLVAPDRIETGTFAIAAAAAGGQVTLDGARPATTTRCGACWSAPGRRSRRAGQRDHVTHGGPAGRGCGDRAVSRLSHRSAGPVHGAHGPGAGRFGDPRDHLREPIHARARAHPAGRGHYGARQ